MNRAMRSLAAAVLFLSACAGYSPAPYWTLKQETFATLKPGVTTKEDVRKLIGAPITESHFPRQGEDVWEYRCMDGQTVTLVYVYFDLGGRFKHYTHMPDPARYSVYA